MKSKLEEELNRDLDKFDRQERLNLKLEGI